MITRVNTSTSLYLLEFHAEINGDVDSQDSISQAGYWGRWIACNDSGKTEAVQDQSQYFPPQYRQMSNCSNNNVAKDS